MANFHFILKNAIVFPNKTAFIHSKINFYPQNIFIKINEQEINELAKITPIPPELKQFWQEVGEGFINSNHDGTVVSDCNNQILSPSAIQAILLGDTDDYRPDFDLETNTLPFFEVTPASFICMKENEIYWMHGGKIAHSLHDFIQMLFVNPNIDWVDFHTA